ncbi:MAG: mannose-1-phosphate guanylyltransferase [Limnochordales bacterium]
MQLVNGTQLVAVVIAGGSGTRFWPLSTADRPKQFLALFGQRTLLQATVDRLQGLVPPERTLIVTAARFAGTVRAQLPHIPLGNIIAEPQARDTAAAIALAGLVCRRRFGNPVMAVLPADHVIEPAAAFHRALRSAAAAARGTGRLYTFGIRPTYPATGYGYLQAGEPAAPPAGEDDGELPHFRVQQFREKPTRDVAEEYVRAGNYYWNSGMFVWSTDTLLAAVERYLPEHARRLFPLEAYIDTPQWEEQLAAAFGRVPKISVDYGIMEKAAEVYMIAAPFRWSDVGGWAALADFLDQDAAGNAVRGVVHGLDARGNVVFCEDASEVVALVGVEDLIVVRAGNRTLVARKDRAEDVKRLVEAMGQPGSG